MKPLYDKKHADAKQLRALSKKQREEQSRPFFVLQLVMVVA